MKILLSYLLRFYRYFVSPWLGNRCRFFPSCSAYALTALERHGVWRGAWLTLRRLSRCHPWHEGGIDEVPTDFVQRKTKTRCTCTTAPNQ